VIQGGGNREDLRPLNADGQYTPGARGTHKGHSASLNVRNPMPGYVYYWENNQYDWLVQRANEGWEVVPPDSQERKGLETDQRFGQTLDSHQARRDVVLMRIPEEQYRVLKDQEAAVRRNALSSTADNYTSRGEPYQRRYGQSAGGPLYYRGPGHSTQVE
jgi:hypothetical protein